MAKGGGRIRISKRTVDEARPRVSRFTLWDQELSGFGLRVEPSGAKSYVIRYRANGGGRGAPERLLTLGRHGALTPEAARRLARTRLGEVAAGKDPAGARAAKRREITMADLVDLYAKEGLVVQRGKRQGEPMKPQTATFTLARLRHHLVPLLGRKKVTEIGPGDVERFVRDITAGRTARDEKIPGKNGERGKRIIVRGGEGAARKVVRDVSAVFSFARRHGIVTSNPVDDAAIRKVDNQIRRFLSLDEVQRLGAALKGMEEGVNPKALNITRLWALTGCRRNEVAGLRWSEVDLDNGLLVMTDTKSGKSVRPLGAAARALLASIPQELGPDGKASPYIFPATSGSGFYSGTKRLWPRIIDKAGLGADVTPHVLRHTMGSQAASSGEALLIIGAVLGHANPRSTALYAHISHDPARRAADRLSNSVAAALEGRPAGHIIPLPKGRC
jgi:integrase